MKSFVIQRKDRKYLSMHGTWVRNINDALILQIPYCLNKGERFEEVEVRKKARKKEGKG